MVYNRLTMFQFTRQDASFAHKEDFASSPKDEFHKHMHPFYEVIFLVEGSVEFHVEGTKYDLSPGNVVLIKPGKFHFAEVDRKARYERYVFKIPENALPEFVINRLSSMGPFFPGASSLLPLFQEFDRYADSYEKDELYTLCVARMNEIFICLSKLESVSLLEEEEDSVAQEIVDYIEEHISEKMTLASIASALNYSPSYIATSFRSEMRVPLMQYIRSKKVHASLTLINHGMKPQEAALQIGFNDYSTFYRCYLKVLGKKPSEVKKEPLRMEEAGE